MKNYFQIMAVAVMALISCAPAANADGKAFENHANDVYKVLNAALAEIMTAEQTNDQVNGLVSELVTSAKGSCMKKTTLQGFTWPDAPQGTAQCIIEVVKDGEFDAFKVTIIGDQSTGNFRYTAP